MTGIKLKTKTNSVEPNGTTFIVNKYTNTNKFMWTL